MTIKEIYNATINKSNKEVQMILKFSNDNDVVITKESWNPDSSFIRRSRRRLTEDFQLVCDNGDSQVYRTFSGKVHEYVLYVAADFEILHAVIKEQEYKKAEKMSAAVTSEPGTAKDKLEGKPSYDGVMHILPIVKDNKFWTQYYCTELKDGVFNGSETVNTTPHAYMGEYLAVLNGLRSALKYPDKVSVVKIHQPRSARYRDGAFKFATGEWKPYNPFVQHYVDKINELKDKLAAVGISIVFVRGGRKSTPSVRTGDTQCPNIGNQPSALEKQAG